MPLLFAVLLLVLIEISLFVTVGGAIGLPGTLAIILGTGVLGGLILRAQGQKALARMVDTVMEPRGLLAAAGDGMLVALAGILLILPGFLTDLAGLILLVPPVRQAILRRFASYAQHHPGNVAMHVVVRPGSGDAARYDPLSDGDIIEGEVLDAPPDSTHPGRSHR